MKKIILGFLLIFGCLVLVSAQVRRVKKYQKLLAYDMFIKGVYYYNDRAYNAAIDAFIKALEYTPNDFRIRMWLGKSYYHAGYERNAISEWERVINQGGGTNLLRQKLNFIFFQRSIGRRFRIETSYIPLKTVNGVQNKRFTFVHPTSVAMRGPKELFIAGFSSGGVYIFDQNGKIKGTISKANNNLVKPYGLAFDDNGNLFITDFGADMIHVFDKRNNYRTSFGGFGIQNGKFSGPEGIFINNNDIYVVDSGNNRVQQFKINSNFDVTFMRAFGKRGTTEGKFFRPTDVAVKNNKIYVSDLGNRRIQVFDDSGNYLNQFGSDYLKKPRGILFIDENNLLVADEQAGIVKYNILESSWHIIRKRDKKEIFSPVDMFIDKHNMMYIADYGRKNLLVMIPEKLKYVNLMVDIRQSFNKDYPLVTHKVYVTDRLNRTIRGLDESNFKIFEFNKKIKVYSVKPFKAPHKRMRIVVLNDRSVKMKKYNTELKELMNIFLKRLKSYDRVKILNFGKTYKDMLPFTNERLRPLEAITVDNYSNEANLGKAFYEGVSKTFSNHQKPRILLITNGKLSEDSFSPYGIESLMNYAKNNNVPVYILCFGSGPRVDDLKLLAKKTKGRFFSAANSNNVYKLEEIMRAREDNFYMVTYTTQSASVFAKKAWRTLRIEVLYKQLFGLDQGGYYIP